VIFPQELSENTIGKDYIFFFSEPKEVSPGKRVLIDGRGGDAGCPENVFGRATGRSGGQGKAGVRDRRRGSGARGP